MKEAFAPNQCFSLVMCQVLHMQYLADYKDLVARQFETYVTQHHYNVSQIRLLRAVQSMFLQKHHLETADLYEPPLDMFGADAIERWFSEIDITAIIKFVQKLDTGDGRRTIGRTDRSI
jgi:type I restriction enzyme R subunit